MRRRTTRPRISRLRLRRLGHRLIDRPSPEARGAPTRRVRIRSRCWIRRLPRRAGRRTQQKKKTGRSGMRSRLSTARLRLRRPGRPPTRRLSATAPRARKRRVRISSRSWIERSPPRLGMRPWKREPCRSMRGSRLPIAPSGCGGRGGRFRRRGRRGRGGSRRFRSEYSARPHGGVRRCPRSSDWCAGPRRATDARRCPAVVRDESRRRGGACGAGRPAGVGERTRPCGLCVDRAATVSAKVREVADRSGLPARVRRRADDR